MNHNLGTNMSHDSSSVNGEGTSPKNPLSRILDELSSLNLWKENLERSFAQVTLLASVICLVCCVLRQTE